MTGDSVVSIVSRLSARRPINRWCIHFDGEGDVTAGVVQISLPGYYRVNKTISTFQRTCCLHGYHIWFRWMPK
jgi:hypothetical protein